LAKKTIYDQPKLEPTICHFLLPKLRVRQKYTKFRKFYETSGEKKIV
jgi:hypothetical protein